MADANNRSCAENTHIDESPCKKQKPDEAAASSSPSTKGKFKIVGRVVMAMKRFQASLNPTYSYGKRSSDGAVEHTDGHRVAVQPHMAAANGKTTSGRTASGRTTSGRPSSAGQQHGHKGSLLFRPLAEVDAVKSR